MLKPRTSKKVWYSDTLKHQQQKIKSVYIISTPPQIKTSKNEYSSNSMAKEEKGRGNKTFNVMSCTR